MARRIAPNVLRILTGVVLTGAFVAVCAASLWPGVAAADAALRFRPETSAPPTFGPRLDAAARPGRQAVATARAASVRTKSRSDAERRVGSAASAAAALLDGSPYASSNGSGARRSDRSQGPWPALYDGAERDAGLPAKPRSGDVGFAVIDIDTGEIVERRLSQHPFIPASVAKIPTALYAIDALGAEHVFSTSVYAVGAIENGVLKGDLHLVGGGDPTLDTADLSRLARSLAKTGLKSVDGQFFYNGDAALTQQEIEPGQPIYAAYNPAISGLSLNFNRVLFKWVRNKGGSYAVEVKAHASKKSIVAQNIDGGVMTPDAHRANLRYRSDAASERERWDVSTAILGRKGSRWLPVRSPGRYAAGVFRALAAEAGVALPAPQAGPSPMHDPQARLLAHYESRPLKNVLRGMLKFSTNLTAEMVGLAASARRGDRERTLEGSARRMEQWLEQRYDIGPTPIAAAQTGLVNHSGLSPKSRATPLEVAALLARVGAEPQEYETLNWLLPRHGVRGLAGATVRAKTGTMYWGRGLAGYLQCKSGRRFAFSYFNSDIESRDAFDRSFDPLSDDKPKNGSRWFRAAKKIERELLKRWTRAHC